MQHFDGRVFACLDRPDRLQILSLGAGTGKEYKKAISNRSSSLRDSDLLTCNRDKKGSDRLLVAFDPIDDAATTVIRDRIGVRKRTSAEMARHHERFQMIEVPSYLCDGRFIALEQFDPEVL